MYVTKPKLALFVWWQANKLGDKLLEQGMMTFIRKLTDQVDGRLMFQKKKNYSLSRNSVSSYTEEGKGKGPVGCQPMAEQYC